jgi:hypothetical protein
MKNNDLLFAIKKSDAQFFAKDKIKRKLTDDELNSIKIYLKWAFEDWGIILHEAIDEIAEPDEDLEEDID